MTYFKTRKSKDSFLLISGLMTIGLLAYAATHYGSYHCGSCSFSGGHNIDGNNFIRTTVNQDVATWRPGDTVTIVDSAGNQAKYKYTAGGQHVPNGPVQPGPAGGEDGGGGGGDGSSDLSGGGFGDWPGSGSGGGFLSSVSCFGHMC